ncbi:MAG: InlB B-repeat-containing protein, partial [Spirochaetales bacterium]|nr:InlB B-repeat-containing protein [Spirochaetales bacterium]
MKKNYFVLAVIAVMMMFVGCDTEGSDSKDDDQSSAAPQQTQPQQPQQPQPQPQPGTVTYTFKANGGKWSDNTTADKTVSGAAGATVTAPTDPTRTGYSFSNWDKAVPSVFDGTDDAFTAQWTANTYIVKFDKNGGEGDMSSMDMTYDVSKDLSVNTFTRENYVFKGWASSADGEVVYNDGQNVKDLTADNGAEVKLYAKWRYKNYHDEVSGNIVMNNVEYPNTSFVQVIDSAVTVDGTDDNWSSYLDGSAENYYKGAFINGRNVKLSPYSMGQYLVTQELYEAVMSSGRNYDNNSTDEGKHPAYYVSWYDAITFCNKLSLLMGKEPCYTVSGITDWAALAYSSIPTSTDSTWNEAVCDITKNGYRLPTEAEWEFA